MRSRWPRHHCTTKEPMKKANRLIVILMLSVFLAACRIDVNQLIQSEEVLTIQVYKSSGTGITTKEIRKGDETFTRFKKWLEENEKGWEPSPVTFVPSVEVRGKKFVLNFHPRRAILNFQSPDGKYHQYVKDIAEADFQYLLSK